MAKTLIILTVFIIYWMVVETLKVRGYLERYNISAFGPILMIRTSRGLKFLDRLAKHHRLWRGLANIASPVILIGMAYMFSLILFMDYFMIAHPMPPGPAQQPRNILLLPGINQFIPLVWGLIGLVVTLVVHEFSHAVMCRVEGIRVKSLGLLLALVPIGGFAEPDEKELLGKEGERIANKKQRIRVFSSGVISNFLVAFFAFVIFIASVNSISPVGNIMVSQVDPDSPGDLAGFQKGMVIASINDEKVNSYEDLLNGLKTGGTVTVYYDGKYSEIQTGIINGTGVKIIELMEDYPGIRAGLEVGMIIYQIDDTPTPDLNSFIQFMRNTTPGQTIEIYIMKDEQQSIIPVTLTDAPQGNYGFIGVVVQNYMMGLTLTYFPSDTLLNNLKNIPQKLKSFTGWIWLTALPFVEFRGFVGDMMNFFQPAENVAFLQNGIFWIANAFFWIAWINLYVGLFNCLPAIPLDGGRILEEYLDWIFKKLGKKKGSEYARKIVTFLAFLIFSSFIFALISPYILFR